MTRETQTPPFSMEIIYWLVFIRQGSIIEMTKKMHRYTFVSVWGYEFQPNTWHPFPPGLSIKKTLVSPEKGPLVRAVCHAARMSGPEVRCFIDLIDPSPLCTTLIKRRAAIYHFCTLIHTHCLYTHSVCPKSLTLSYAWLYSPPLALHFCFIENMNPCLKPNHYSHTDIHRHQIQTSKFCSVCSTDWVQFVSIMEIW